MCWTWFDLVGSGHRHTKYGILDKDTFNFDKTGFMMGVVLLQLVVTRSYRYSWPKLVQPGGWTWTIVIQGVSTARGSDTPLYHLC